MAVGWRASAIKGSHAMLLWVWAQGSTSGGAPDNLTPSFTLARHATTGAQSQVGCPSGPSLASNGRARRSHADLPRTTAREVEGEGRERVQQRGRAPGRPGRQHAGQDPFPPMEPRCLNPDDANAQTRLQCRASVRIFLELRWRLVGEDVSGAEGRIIGGKEFPALQRQSLL